LDEVGQEDAELFLKNNKIRKLKDFQNHSEQANSKFEWFAANTPREEYLKVLADSKKAKKFLGMWLDQYGHNSIARMGTVWLCCEEVSILAAKSIEWTRPGAGYVELSTRFVDREGAGVYPIEKELARLGYDPRIVTENFSNLFCKYGYLQGDSLNGSFPSFLRERWGELVTKNNGNVELGVAGETFDVLGNLLPAATLTSVSIAASGESLPSILRHLLLDDTAEGRVLVEMIVQEAVKIGADQFIRHFQPTPTEVTGWGYKATVKNFRKDWGMKAFVSVPGSESVQNILWEVLKHKSVFLGMGSTDMNKIAEMLFKHGRGNHDKLPREFELVTVPFWGSMSFRGWRDLHRQGFSTHRRTLLKPDQFYRYDKPHPNEIDDCFNKVERTSYQLYHDLSEVPRIVRQYVLPMGFSIGFMYSANLRQHEFCNWQRTKPSVNHEVRQVFLSGERELRRIYRWWPLFSRADITPAYVFARGSAVPLSD
jgi:thymidylate synthase ThyX